MAEQPSSEERLPVRPIQDVILPAAVLATGAGAAVYQLLKFGIGPESFGEIAANCANTSFPVACRVVGVFAEYFGRLF